MERGDRVIVFTDNSLACVVSIFGTLIAGGVFVVVNPQTKEDKLAYILDDSEASFLVTEGTIARVAAAGSERGAVVKASVIAAGGGDEIDGMLSTRASSRTPSPRPRSRARSRSISPRSSTRPAARAIPKGVMMTHANMVFAAGSVSEYLRLGPEHRIMNVLPLAFDYGLYQLLMSVRMQATLVLERSFVYPGAGAEAARGGARHGLSRRADRVLDPRLDARAVTAPVPVGRARHQHRRGAPAQLPRPAEGDLPERARLPHVRADRVQARELPRAGAARREAHVRREGDPGHRDARARREDGRPSGRGRPGVLHVRGPHVMAGYWRLPDRTAEMLVEGPLPGERMLCTHDHFTIDDEGFLYFVGRSDDIIKSRGEKVSPAEVEDALYAIPGVREAAVIGVPDERLGEAIHAYVALDEDAELTERDVIGACRERLEGFMVPSRVVFLDELPKTASGKIRKKGLSEPTAAARAAARSPEASSWAGRRPSDRRSSSQTSVQGLSGGRVQARAPRAEVRSSGRSRRADRERNLASTMSLSESPAGPVERVVARDPRAAQDVHVRDPVERVEGPAAGSLARRQTGRVVAAGLDVDEGDIRPALDLERVLMSVRRAPAALDRAGDPQILGVDPRLQCVVPRRRRPTSARRPECRG